MPTITLTRQQLYDRAWTKPLDALAKELGLSGRGLGKLCDRHDIPVPPLDMRAKTAPILFATLFDCRGWPVFCPRTFRAVVTSWANLAGLAGSCELGDSSG